MHSREAQIEPPLIECEWVLEYRRKNIFPTDVILFYFILFIQGGGYEKEEVRSLDTKGGGYEKEEFACNLYWNNMSYSGGN